MYRCFPKGTLRQRQRLDLSVTHDSCTHVTQDCEPLKWERNVIFSVYIVDHVGWLPARQWSETRRDQVCRIAKTYLDQVLQAAGHQTIVSAAPGTPRPHEPVIHLVRDQGQSIIAREGGQLTPNSGGNTGWVNGRMISEVYVQLSNSATGVANLVVHELLHNKTDSHPTRRLTQNIHNLGRRAGFHSFPNLVPRWNNNTRALLLRSLPVRIPQEYAPRLGFPPPK
jgi:hypothetical protein